MKILICGLGSIGRRHAINLLKLKKKKLIFFRERNLNLKQKKLSRIKTFQNLQKALQEKPKIAFICNPTSKHLDTAIKCAQKNCHLFIEKPLSNNLSKLDLLKKIVKKKKLKVMIGYHMRFHPLMIKIKNLLEKKELGKIVNFRTEWSEFLPDWHPWEHYKTSYAAKKSLGGGCSLTLSHQIDSLYWLFGKIKMIYNIKTFGHLGLNVDTASDYLLQFSNNIVGYCHVDYLQKPHKRSLKIIGLKKTLCFDYFKNRLTITNRLGEKKTYKNFSTKNNMYIEEVKFFLNSIRHGTRVRPNIDESEHILKKIL